METWRKLNPPSLSSGHCGLGLQTYQGIVVCKQLRLCTHDLQITAPFLQRVHQCQQLLLWSIIVVLSCCELATGICNNASLLRCCIYQSTPPVPTIEASYCTWNGMSWSGTARSRAVVKASLSCSNPASSAWPQSFQLKAWARLMPVIAVNSATIVLKWRTNLRK